MNKRDIGIILFFGTATLAIPTLEIKKREKPSDDIGHEQECVIQPNSFQSQYNIQYEESWKWTNYNFNGWY